MLTREFSYYAIETTKSEYSSSEDEYFDTFDEALRSADKYADWYCSKGTCIIKRVLLGSNTGTKTYRITDVWEVVGGCVVKHDADPFLY